MADEFEAGVTDEMLDIGLAPGEEIIEADDIVTLSDQAITEVGTEESGSAGDENTQREEKLRGKKRGVKEKNHYHLFIRSL